ncbi:hypothetical protein HWV62_16692 [Athelia sp. TMB]|nr:hypothetical protein HWV62_16692 [Athelia sp. TMB]
MATPRALSDVSVAHAHAGPGRKATPLQSAPLSDEKAIRLQPVDDVTCTVGAKIHARTSSQQMDPFALFYRDVRELEAAEKSGNPEKLKKFKFSIAPQTSLCHTDQKYMTRLPQFRSVLEQFSWSRIEADGTFPAELIKARLKVLGSGGVKFGYWSVPGGQQSHDTSTYVRNAGDMGPVFTRRSEEYMHGDIMLEKEWPTDIEMWKIDEKNIPHLFFTDEYPPPKQVMPGDVKDWKGWHEWRGLTFDSPAALLMDAPLSVYHLLVDILHVIDTKSTPEKRQKLKIHFLGAEVELNFLPLFSELALLLPNTDIELEVFGKPAFDLVHQARKNYPDSIATNDIVWSYTAPRKCGGGSINIKLHAKDENWTRTTLGPSGPDDIPQAMVGLNAGLDIPFAVTEYAEQSADQAADSLPTMKGTYLKALSPATKEYRQLAKPRDNTITVNPFHRPGQRSLPVVRMPNAYSGFVIPIVRGVKV